MSGANDPVGQQRGHVYNDAEKAFLLNCKIPDRHDEDGMFNLAMEFNTTFGTNLSPLTLYTKAKRLRKQSRSKTARNSNGNNHCLPRRRSPHHRGLAAH